MTHGFSTNFDALAHQPLLPKLFSLRMKKKKQNCEFVTTLLTIINAVLLHKKLSSIIEINDTE